MSEKTSETSDMKQFPLIEGISIFVGIIAWDMFMHGKAQILKAAVIALVSSLIWFGLRQWRNKTEQDPHIK